LDSQRANKGKIGMLMLKVGSGSRKMSWAQENWLPYFELGEQGDQELSIIQFWKKIHEKV